MRSAALSLVNLVERHADRLKARVGRRLGPPARPRIQAYRSFGTDGRLHVRGRVLDDPPLRRPTPDDTLFDNVAAMLRRMESDEMPGVRLRVTLGDAVAETVTDEEGYFSATLFPEGPLPAETRWHEARVELVEVPGLTGARAEALSPVLVPPATAQFGVISDVDDTVLQTGATDFVGMMRTTFAGNAHTRLPFEGVAAFYRALATGRGTTDDNPVFYVSSSPWNLYDLLVDFLEIQGLPRGPLLLRDLGIDATKFIKAGHMEHKTAIIEEILATYPDLPFILIGDSGQHDPEIYAHAARRHPGRVQAIYIRDVAPALRDAQVERLSAELALENVEMVVVPDSLAAARHAAGRGWIRPDALPDVAAEKAKDRAAGHES